MRSAKQHEDEIDNRIDRLLLLIDEYGLETIAKEMNLSETHINRNLLTGKSIINLVKLIAVERKLLNKS